MIFDRKNKKAQKLTASQVADIRLHYEGGATQGALARHFGVSVGQIGRIVRGESWVEGAKDRGPSPKEADEALTRLLTVQQEVLQHGPLPPKSELAPPVSVLDEEGRDLAKEKGWL